MAQSSFDRDAADQSWTVKAVAIALRIDSKPLVIRFERARSGRLLRLDANKHGRICGIGHRTNGDRKCHTKKHSPEWGALHIAVADASRVAFSLGLALFAVSIFAASPSLAQSPLSIFPTRGSAVLNGKGPPTRSALNTSFPVFTSICAWDDNGRCTLASSMTPDTIEANLGYTPANKAGDTVLGAWLGTAARQSPIVDLYSHQPPNNYFGLCPGGACISYIPRTGGVFGTDTIRAANYMRMTTAAGVERGETTLSLDAYMNTGAAPDWRASTTYATGSEVIANGNLYTATTGGRSRANGSGPSGRGTSISDGSASWAYVAPGDINPGKTNLSLTTAVGPQSSPAWGAAFNYILLPGWSAAFAAGVELDFSSLSGRDCWPGNSCTVIGLFLSGQPQFTGTEMIDISNASSPPAIYDKPAAWVTSQTVAIGTVEQNGGHAYKATTGGKTASSGLGPVGTTSRQTDGSVKWAYYGEMYGDRVGGAWHDGIKIEGKTTIANHAIVLSENSQISIWAPYGATHSQAFLQDLSDAPVGIQVGGRKTYASVQDFAKSPYGIRLDGTYGIAAMRSDNFMVGRATLAGYDALTFNASLVSSGLAGFFSSAADPSLYANVPIGSRHETRVGGATMSTQDATGITEYGTIVGRKTLQLLPTTVAALPKCDMAAQGTQAAVSDLSAAPTYRQTGLTGGGANYGHVECNGVTWEAH